MFENKLANVCRFSLMVFAAILGGGNSAYCQFGSDSHSVTVVVQQITIVQTNVGSIAMQITSTDAIAGQDLMSISNQTGILLWGTNVSSMKTTVSTNLLTPLYTLKVGAINPTQGTPTPEVILSTTPTDFLRDIGRSSGTCSILYTGIASAQTPSGTDSHVITFTIQSQ